jgi:hypothetical protein
MEENVKKTLLIAVALVSFNAFAFAGGDKNQNRYDGELGEGPTKQERISNLNEDALQVRQLEEYQKDIIYGIYEEEKLARDVYITLGEMYPKENTFANIQLSEQTHMDAVRNLCVKYGICVPEPDQEVGEFNLGEMKELYESLVSEGSQSKLNALVVGQDIEKMDIEDLAQASNDMPIDIQKVFANLMSGSINHLATFTNAIEMETSQ